MNARPALALALVLAFGRVGSVFAQEPAATPLPPPVPAAAPPEAVPAVDPQAELAHRPRIGLVLSGGGARGAAHVGVLQVLEEMRIPVDAIAGTSMGSIVGGLYASGMSPQLLGEALSSVDWNRALTDSSARDLLSFRRKQDDLTLAMKARVGLKGMKPSLPLGLVQGQKLEILLRSFVLPAATVDDFDHLVYPFRAVAADLSTTNPVVLAKGDLVRAMRASMSVPVIFAPVVIDGTTLIDGGVADNLPVDVVRKMGVDVVIAVDISTPLSKLEDLSNAYAVSDQMTTGLMRRETERQLASLGPSDVAIVPDLADYGAADFTKAKSIIPLGAVAARAVADKLQRYSLSPAAWAEYRAGLRSFAAERPEIARVTLSEDSALSEHYVNGLLDIEAGQKLDPARLETDLQRVYGLALFEKVSYDLTTDGPGKVDLNIDARQRTWGHDYLEFGLALGDNLENQTGFDFNFRLNKLAVTKGGAEWRTDLRIGEHQRLATEFYQPFGGPRTYFWAAHAEVRREDVLFFLGDGTASGVFRLHGGGGGVDVGRALGSWGELRFGYERDTGRLTPARDVGDGVDLDDGRLALQFGTDTLDSAEFPRHGWHSHSELDYSDEALGSTDNLGRGSFFVDRVGSHGRHTLLLGLQGAGFFDDTKVNFPYTLGGIGHLSGLGLGSLVGRYTALARTIYYYRFLDVSLAAIEMPLYAGGSVEYGDAWLHSSQVDLGNMLLHGSLFLGVDSPLGPVYLGAGFGEHHERAAFFLLGRPF